MSNYIKVRKEWFEILLRRAKNVDITKIKDLEVLSSVAMLVGFAESAEFILNGINK